MKMGGGVILRVGDRTSVFDSRAMRFLGMVAAELRDGRFPVQRALMSGGTCEATAFQEFGYQTGAVCVALGHYHNRGPGNSIRAEFVSASDACGMVELLVAAARALPRFEALADKLRERLDGLLRQARHRLP